MDDQHARLATTTTTTRLAAVLLPPVSLLLIISVAATNTLEANAQQEYQQQISKFNWALAPTEPCQQLRIVRRQEWGAKRSLDRLDSFRPSSSAIVDSGDEIPKRVFVHQAWDGRSCADIDSCSIRLQAIQSYHQHTKGWPDISYNFLISADGTVYEGLGFAQVGFHTLDYNHNSLGIAFIGTFQDIYPTAPMERALQHLMDCAVDSDYLVQDYMLHGHRDARCTICPGNAAYERISQMAHFRPGPLARYSCPRRSEPQNNPAGVASLSSLMMMQNREQKQQVQVAAQVLNINSNNHVSVAAVMDGGRGGIPVAATIEEERATIMGAIQQNKSFKPRESHSEKSLFRDEDERDDGDGGLVDSKASLNKDQVILVNIQPRQVSELQPQQPIFYLLTTKSILRPTLLLSPGVGSQSSAGANMDRGDRPSRTSDGSTNFNDEEDRRGGDDSNRGYNSDRGTKGADRRPSRNSSGGGSRGGSGSGQSNGRSQNNQNTPGDESQTGGGGGGGGESESLFQTKEDIKPVSL